MFGPATTMTADAPVSAVLRDITHGRWVNADTEAETGCGIVPFTYRERNYVHALQWGIGLELFLLSRDPWRLVLSTDHPNGGSFLSYPRLIRLLMDREFRNEQIRRVNKRAMRRTVLLDDLDREYTLEEIAIITRAGPARLLGLRDKGQLGVGADADITIYDDRADREEMFAAPRYVIKDGRAVVEDGELREAVAGRLLRVGADYDPSIEPTLEKLFEDRYSVQFASYPVTRAVAARAGAHRRRGAAMKLHGAEIADTFAEAFPMWGARVVITAATPAWALEAGALDDRLRDVGDRLQVRGGHRARARARRDARRAAGRQRAAVRDGPRGRGQAAGRARRAVRADLPDGRLLQRPGGRGRRSTSAASCATSATAIRRARCSTGERYWRVPVMEGEFLVQERFGVVEGVAGGQHHHARARRGIGAAGGGGRGARDALPSRA